MMTRNNLTNRDHDSQDDQVILSTCQACGYYQEYFTGRGLKNRPASPEITPTSVML